MIETLAGLIQSAGHELPPVVARQSLENPKTPLHTIFDVEPASTGQVVNSKNVLQISTAWACIRYIAGSVAGLPLVPYRRTETGSEKARDHYLHWILNENANEAMTAYRFRHLMQTWVLLHGNAYAAIDTNGRGQVTALLPMNPSQVTVKVAKGGGLLYEYQSADGQKIQLLGEDVLHLRWMSTDGIMGNSPVAVHRQTFGMALGMKESGAKFFASGMQISGVLASDQRLSPVARENLETGLMRYKGLSNAWKVLILEEGMKYSPMQATMKDAEYLGMIKATGEDVARIYGVPQHIVGMLDRSTNNNIEHQGLEAVTVTLSEHIKSWETEIHHSLLSKREREFIYVKHKLEALLRGDVNTRYTAYASALQNGWMTINEVRELEEHNPVEGGDIPRTQMQMVPLGFMPEQQQQKQIEGGSDGKA